MGGQEREDEKKRIRERTEVWVKRLRLLCLGKRTFLLDLYRRGREDSVDFVRRERLLLCLESTVFGKIVPHKLPRHKTRLLTIERTK